MQRTETRAFLRVVHMYIPAQVTIPVFLLCLRADQQYPCFKRATAAMYARLTSNIFAGELLNP
jgi:hypothetical protein